MTVIPRKELRVLLLFGGGVLLNFMLWAIAGALLEKHFELQKHLLEARRSDTAYAGVQEAFRAKNKWRDFAFLPIMGCLMGAYAALLQKGKAPLLAVACLLPMFVSEVAGDPVRTWSLLTDAQFFGMRGVQFVLAAAAATYLRTFLEKRRSSVA